mgnify:CR=1 FL=1
MIDQSIKRLPITFQDASISTRKNYCFFQCPNTIKSTNIHKLRQQKDVFSVIPMTFLISKGLNDPEF